MMMNNAQRAVLLLASSLCALTGCAVATPSSSAAITTTVPTSPSIVEPTVIRRTGGLSGETVELILYADRPSYTLRRIAPGGAAVERSIPAPRPEHVWGDDLPRLVARLDVPGGERVTPAGAYQFQIRRGDHTVRFNTAADLAADALAVMEAFDWLIIEPAEQAPASTGPVRAPSATRPSTKPANPRAGAARVIMRIYDIDDLLPAPFVPPEAAGDAKSRAMLVDDLKGLFQDTIIDRPLRMDERDGMLTVSAPPAAHRMVVNLLEQLRESKLLTIWLEAVLVQIPPAPRDPDARALRARLEAVAARPAPSWPRGSRASGFGPATRPAGAGATLEDDEFKAIVRAAEANREAQIVRLPRLSVLSGRRGVVRAGSEVEYVSGIKAPGAAGHDRGADDAPTPVRSTAFDGTTFEANVTLRDLRQIKMNVRCVVSRVGHIESIEPADDAAAEAAVMIERPQVDLLSLGGLVEVPARQTVVLRGFTESSTGRSGDPVQPRDDLFLLIRTAVPLQGLTENDDWVKSQLR